MGEDQPSHTLPSQCTALLGLMYSTAHDGHEGTCYTRVCLSLISMLYIYPATLPMVPLYCMPPSLSPSPRSAPSSKLSPLYVPASPVPRAERCKPCPVALVPTLGCSASRSQPLDLLKSIRKFNTGITLFYTPKISKKC